MLACDETRSFRLFPHRGLMSCQRILRKQAKPKFGRFRSHIQCQNPPDFTNAATRPGINQLRNGKAPCRVAHRRRPPDTLFSQALFHGCEVFIMASGTSSKGVIGILTGGGDVPGLNPGDSRRHHPRAARRLRSHRPAPRLGQPDRHGPRQGLRQQRQLPAPHRRTGQSRRPHRRHFPAHFAHQSQPRQERRCSRRTCEKPIAPSATI